MTLEGKCRQDFRAVIRERGHLIAALLDLGDAGVHIDELGLTIGAPVRRAEEEEDQAVASDEIGQPVRLAELIEAGGPVPRPGAGRPGEKPPLRPRPGAKHHQTERGPPARGPAYYPQ